MKYPFEQRRGPSRRGSRRRGSLVVALSVCWLSHARAQTPAAPSSGTVTQPPAESVSMSDAGTATADVEAARALYREGLSLAKAGTYSGAIEAFRRSEALVQHPVTAYNLAYCEAALGDAASAALSYERALTLSARAGSSPDFEARARAGLAEAARVAARIHVTVTGPGKDLRVDGRDLTIVQLDTASRVYVPEDHPATGPHSAKLPAGFDLWLDPGTHRVVATRADGTTVFDTTLSIASTSETSLVVTEPATPTIASTRVKQDPLPASSRAPLEPSVPSRWPMFSSFAFGAAGLVTSGVFLGLTLADKADLESKCGGHVCPPMYADEEDRMKRNANITTVALAAGLVGVGLGVYFWSTEKPASKPRTVRLTPGIGSLRLAGEF